MISNSGKPLSIFIVKDFHRSRFLLRIENNSKQSAHFWTSSAIQVEVYRWSFPGGRSIRLAARNAVGARFGSGSRCLRMPCIFHSADLPLTLPCVAHCTGDLPLTLPLHLLGCLSTCLPTACLPPPLSWGWHAVCLRLQSPTRE